MAPGLLAFVIGLGLALLLAVGGVFAYEQAHAGKIGSGVHAGSVDLSGLTRDEAAARLTAAYASLGQGQLTLNLPDGTVNVSFAALGRHLDATAMVDAALAVGRSGNPLSRVADEIRTALHGATVAPVVTFDQAALKASLAGLATAIATKPMDAAIRPRPWAMSPRPPATVEPSVDATPARQVLWPSVAGRGPAQATIDIAADLSPVAPAISSALATRAADAANAEVSPDRPDPRHR